MAEAREQDHCDGRANQAAMKRHAAMPDGEDLGRVCRIEGKLVEDDMTQAPAEHDAKSDIDEEIVDRGGLGPRPLAPQRRRLDERQREPPAKDKACDVGERVPAYDEGAEFDENRVNRRKGEEKEGHGRPRAVSACPLRPASSRKAGPATSR